jgi:sodium-independent sulfate anion transporter 11
MKSLIDDFVKRGQPLLFYNLKPSIVQMFQAVKPKELKCCNTEDDLNDLLKGVYYNPTMIVTTSVWSM